MYSVQERMRWSCNKKDSIHIHKLIDEILKSLTIRGLSCYSAFGYQEIFLLYILSWEICNGI